MTDTAQLALIWAPTILLIVAVICATCVIINTRDNARLIEQTRLEYEHKLLMDEK